MNIKFHKAILIASLLAVMPVAFSEPVTADSPGVLQAKQTRLDVQEKQKALLEEKRVTPPVTSATSAAPLELPIDETDSPGATKK